MDNQLPAQPAEGPTLNLYFKLRWLYILGFLQTLLGTAIIIIEITGIALFYDESFSFPLEISGVCLGLFVTLSGMIGFYAGKKYVPPVVRHKLFLSGFLLSLFCVVFLIAMSVVGVLWTHYRYEDVKDKSNRLNSEDFRHRPYVFSLEGSSHMAHLRAVAAAVYLMTLLFFLVSLILNAINICKNKANIQTNGSYCPVEKNETVIYNNKKSPISSKLDLPWIDQN